MTLAALAEGPCRGAGSQTLNFLVTGERCSGAGAVLAAINRSGRAFCHGGLVQEDHDAWREEHRRYFGRNDTTVEWAITRAVSPHQYLRRTIFKRSDRGTAASPERGESAV